MPLEERHGWGFSGVQESWCSPVSWSFVEDPAQGSRKGSFQSVASEIWCSPTIQHLPTVSDKEMIMSKASGMWCVYSIPDLGATVRIWPNVSDKCNAQGTKFVGHLSYIVFSTALKLFGLHLTKFSVRARDVPVLSILLYHGDKHRRHRGHMTVPNVRPRKCWVFFRCSKDEWRLMETTIRPRVDSIFCTLLAHTDLVAEWNWRTPQLAEESQSIFVSPCSRNEKRWQRERNTVHRHCWCGAVLSNLL